MYFHVYLIYRFTRIFTDHSSVITRCWGFELQNGKSSLKSPQTLATQDFAPASFLSTPDKNDRCKPFFDGLQRFFVIISTEHSCRSAGTILYIFRCMPANWLRTIFPALLIKNADLLIRFSRPIFRMGPTPAMRPACWPIPATSEAAPQGFQDSGSQAPILPVPPADERCEDQAWHRRQSRISEH